MRPNRFLRLTLTAAMLAIGSSAWCTTGSPAATTAPLPAVAPDQREMQVERGIAQILTRAHYGDRELNGKLAPQIFDHYLEDMDPNRSYFLQSDIDSFADYRTNLDNSIRMGDLQPAFAIYNNYQQRVEQRIQYALKLLDHEPDFAVKETYVFDRQKAPWAQTSTELDDIWRKRVKNDAIELMLSGKTWAQAADVLRKRYQNYDLRTRQVTSEDVFNLFMNAYAHALDPHTDYFSPDQSEEFKIRMSLKLQGIGASLVSDGAYTRVENILPGGPAARDKQLHPDDRITAVGQGEHGDMVDVVGWRLDDVVALIRGTPGTVVRLQILPPGVAPGSGEHMLKLTRDTVKLEAQAAHKKIETVTRGKHTYKVGVISVPAFYSDFNGRQDGDKNYTSLTRDVRKLLQELNGEHVDGVVIDLRNNGGGSLLEATEMTGLFVPHGPVVQIREPDGKVEVGGDDTDGGVAYTGPLAVLVNRFTASASEIFAAAIQDYHRGLVVGTTTYGKGTVQQLLDLNRYVPGDADAGQLKFTMEKFYRVTGSSTQLKGVAPDISLPSPVDPTDVGESTNDSALPWDEITGAEYPVLHSGLDQELAQLNTLHDQRVAKDPAWHLFMDSLHELQVARSQTSISLVMTDRQKQRSQDDKDRLAIANQWRKLRSLPPAASLEDAYKVPPPPASGGQIASADTSSEGDDSNSVEPDVLLQETAQIVADLSTLGSHPAPPAASSVATSG